VGVELRSGERITARVVLSNLDAVATFTRLVEEQDRDPVYTRMLGGLKCGSPYIQIHFTLSELPRFEGDLGFANEGVRWFMAYSRGPEHLQRCVDTCKWGEIPEDPMWAYYIPSVWDESMAPPGKHSATLFSFYFPYMEAGERHTRLKEMMTDRLIESVSRYAPNFKDSIIDKVAFTPLHFEKMYGITKGDYTHGLLIPGQMFDNRPVVGWSDYRTPVENLYICGSSCHPGPGVTAIPGTNCAREVLKAFR
jgi:phytoene dehydrogenase-like protein